MCGICGIINTNKEPVQEDLLRSMMEAMKHRGPDDNGVFIDNHIGLGFVRLSIIDLSTAGHQPMVSEDGQYALIFNGEIYNYIELRRQLEQSGKYRFKTKSDTEVLLNAYREWGKECLHKFNGMFAFAIYHKPTRELFVARDRFGIKPFYYHHQNGRFIFASEQRVLLPLLEQVEANTKALYEYLVYNRTDQGDYTFFKDLNKLPHGSYATFKDGQLKIEKWYDLQKEIKSPFCNAQELYEAFKDSLKLRLRSDVPVGVCLSGGLDSSSIVSVLLKEFNKTDLNTFSAVYRKGEKGDESEFISLYHEQLKQMHFTTPTAGSLAADLDQLIQCHGEPVATLGPYAQFKVMQLAKDHVTVTLDGQGADEQLAGYHYFFASYFKQLFRQFHWLALTRELMAYGKIHRSVLALKYLGLYMSPSFLKDRLSRISHDFIDAEFYRKGQDFSEIRDKLYDPKTLNESLFQHFEYKLEHLLKWEDHNSMWYSLESRVPFLDHNIVERSLSLPAEKIINKGVTKHILREAMKGVLPEKIRLRQDKIGFEMPWEKWFKDPALRDMISDILHSSSFKQRGFLNVDKCVTGFDAFCSGKAGIPKEVWKWFCLELWFRRFIDVS